MKIIYLTLFLNVFIITKVGAYFGLTEKTQLSDLWNIDFDASSLATADHFAAWERNNKGRQPALDYKPVDMKIDKTNSFSGKKKRVAPYRQHHHDMVHEDNEASQSKRTSTSNSFRNILSQLSKENLHNNHYRRPRHQTQTPTRRATPHFDPSRTITHNHGNRVDNHNYKIQSHPDFDSDANSNSFEWNNISSTMPRSRNGRESGKRRDLAGVSRKTQQYLIASSVTDTITPSEVRYRNSMEQKSSTPNETDGVKRLAENQTKSIPDSSMGHFFQFDENVLNSRAIFSNSKSENATKLVHPQKIDKKEAKKLCDSFKLNTYQRRKCRKDSGLPQVLAKATHIAAAECMYQFRYERWNCSLGTSRLHLLNKGNKETAFLYSISSAGLTHSVARACAEGHMESCSCEETFADQVNKEAWLWGGCGDNVHFAAKFAKKFLRSRSNEMDVRAEIDRHNSDLGVRFVKSNVRQTCKCHGVSGSCTTKSCWRKMAPFYEIGRKIKRAYDKAVMVENTSNSSGRPKLVRMKQKRHSSLPERKSSSKTTKRNRNRKSRFLGNSHKTRAAKKIPDTESEEEFKEGAPRKKELVYLENSPRYCKKTKYSLGTKGRICGKESNCERMCCGRGYTTHVRIIRRSCQCQVKWCCYVQCKTCNERKQIRTCK